MIGVAIDRVIIRRVLAAARGTRLVEAIGWDMAQDLATVQEHPALDLAFVLEANNYGGQNGVQLNLRGVRPAEKKSGTDTFLFKKKGVSL